MLTFLTLSLSLTPAMVVIHRISNTSSLFLSIFHSVQDSEPYVAIGKIRALYIDPHLDSQRDVLVRPDYVSEPAKSPSCKVDASLDIISNCMNCALKEGEFVYCLYSFPIYGDVSLIT